MKELFNHLRSCATLSCSIATLQSKQNKSQKERNELKYKQEVFEIQLKYLDELILRELNKKGYLKNDKETTLNLA